jgi:branched-chain amino acid transport system substrate-binding protein
VKHFAYFLIVLGLVGCTTSRVPESRTKTPSAPAKPVAPKPIAKQQKFALLVPLSGPHAEVGRSLEQAAELGLLDKADQDLELLIRDTRGTAEGAREAAQEAIREGAGLILGPLLAHEVTAINLIVPPHVPVLAFSNNQAVAGRNVFTLGYAPAGQIERIGRYAAAHGIQNIVVFTPQDEYGNLVMDVFKSLQTQGILNIAAHISYKNPTTLPPLTAKNVQGLFFAEGGNQLNTMLESLQSQGVRLAEFKLLGSSQWDHPQVLSNPKLIGALFVSSEPIARQGFEQKYEQAYGLKPPRIASLAYDAVSLVAALTKMNKAQPFTVQNLLQPQGFIGIEGIFRLQANGTVERGLAIHEITGSGSRIVDPAPKKF